MSRYSIAGLAGTLAGLISFPILTRMLSVSDYGLLTLIITTITFIAAFGKCGLQFSIVRYYSDIKDKVGAGRWDRSTYYSSIVFSMMGIGLFVTIIWMLVVYFLPDTTWGEPKLRYLFLLTGIVILSSVTLSMLTGFLQARQQSGWLSLFKVSECYGVLIAVVITLYFITRSLEGVFIARILVHVTLVSILAFYVLRNIQLSPHSFSPKMTREMLTYGMPLLGNELVFVIFSLGDRYIINWKMGSESLGIYAAGYALCEYIKIMMVDSLFQAIRPMYFQIWAEKGVAATKNFIENSLYFYLIICFPVIAGAAVVGPDLLTFITGGKYTESGVVIPYIIAGQMIYGTHSMLGAGIFIKKSSALMWITFSAALVNVLLNIVFIPVYGIEGAAMATLISYLLMTVSETLYSRQLLVIDFPFLAALKFIIISILMYFVLDQIEIDGLLLNEIMIKIIVGGLLYGSLLLITDHKARSLVMERLKK
ncbi:MAG: lipopolysaccharide biosynthesis protein [Gammaproteobacteria bacterium]